MAPMQIGFPDLPADARALTRRMTLIVAARSSPMGEWSGR